MIQEIKRTAPNGIMALLVLFVAQAATIAMFIISKGNPYIVIPAVIAALIVFICWFGLFMVHPNEAKVLQLFGKYVGTVEEPGLRWANPFFQKTAVSVRVRNFESSRMKVNDNSGNPIEIGAVVVWQVIDTAEAIFRVDDYEDFVSIQSEAAIRNLATSYPYDSKDDETVALRSSPAAIAEHLKREVQDRLEKAGVEVIEARISHLAYAPEIANAMLRRQQASAIIDARQLIVEGAVGMVEQALDRLDERGIVDLDEERKASMVSNLLVVLCSDEAAQPIVNTGSLY